MTEIQKFEYLDNEKSFLDELKSILCNYLRAAIWWEKKKKKKKKKGKKRTQDLKVVSAIFLLVCFACLK